MSSIYVFSYFPFGFEDSIWDLIVSVPDHCLSFYFPNTFRQKASGVLCSFSFKSTTENESKERISGSVCSVHCSLILKIKKRRRYIYDRFILNNITSTSLARWQTDLDIDIGSTWKRLFDLSFQISKVSAIGWFQTRINHRILGTNYLLSD